MQLKTKTMGVVSQSILGMGVLFERLSSTQAMDERGDRHLPDVVHESA